MVLIPALRNPSLKTEQLSIFNVIENRFASIARIAVILAGLSGFYMAYQMNAWGRFLEAQYFWMHAMVLIWLMFVVALFVIEPFFIKNHGRMVKDGHNIENLKKTQLVHIVLLVLSLMTIFISVLGAHGFFY
jgi:uncharacterized membrane protein